MNTLFTRINSINLLKFINIDIIIYIIIFLLIFFIINRYLILKRQNNSSCIKILSTTFIDSNIKIVVVHVKNLKFILGITSNKIFKLHTFSKKKKKKK
ncbi:MAG: flagellar biosynthetic protein FliO [Buchnera aphidicola (Periphyllus acericola)]|uniref:flagellar biosynthetic protein FliO n=1 Tax=Buchnera aphidicola TaxID=9 RepID=UPI0030CB5BA1|nr:flagellar biosynthetic protein FliO [Buchnera aphidicola (Periphyllus acericola)]